MSKIQGLRIFIKMLVSAIIVGIGYFFWMPALSVQLRDGIVYFNRPPSLLSATTTFRNANVQATYYFTLNLPPNAGEPLRKVTFVQLPGRESIEFNLEKSLAFYGKPSDKKEAIALKNVTRDKPSGPGFAYRATQSVTVTFDPPIPPNSTLTIGLRSVHNPIFGGIYQFGVTAFPPGDKTHGQFLGFGRFDFAMPGRKH